MEEQGNAIVIAAEVENGDTALQQLQQRIEALENALHDLRSVAASASPNGRRTVRSVSPSASAAALDTALGSLSLEQRIAVKSQMMRGGLL